MSNEATILRIRAQVENLEGLNRARSAVRNFATESKAASNDLGKLRGMFKELGAESLRSVNNLKNYRAGLDALRQSAEIGSTTFNELTLEIKQLDGELGALQGKQNDVTQGFNRITRATNAAAAAQRSYNGLIRNPLTGAYGMPPVEVPMGGRLLPPAQGFDFAAQDARIQAQVAGASAQSAREARRAQKMQGLAEYADTTVGARDPRTDAMIAGGYGPFLNVGTQTAIPFGPQPAPKRAPGRYGGARGLAQGAGAIASGGIFGGPEGAFGGALGFAMAGPQGAVLGAAGGATVGIARQALASTASYSAELQKQRIALSQVVGSQTEYNNSLKFISKTSRELAIPQDIVLKNFTRLSASVIGAGGNVKDAEKAFKGISVGILGTGGNLQSLDAALLATSQVFSKGKVTAEELTGQIGERLPGAFNLFAKSIDKTPQELDKALERGEVTLLDFQKFVEALQVKYNKSAEDIFKSPAAAGVRLEAELSLLKEKVGNALLPIGALFQIVFAEGVKVINDTIDSLSNLGKQFSDAIGGANGLAQIIAGLTKTMIIFGGVTAGVFVVTNITTFSNALRGALKIMKELLSIERIMLGVATARAAIETTIAGLKSGFNPFTKLAGGAVGLTAGVGLVIGVGKIIDDVSNKITSGLAKLTKMPDLTLTQTTTNDGLGVTGGGDGESAKEKRAREAAAKRKKTRQQQILDQQKGFAIDLRKLQEYIVDIQNKGAVAVAKPLDAIYLQYVANTDKIAKDRNRLTDVLQKRIDAMTKLGAEVDPKKAKEFRKAQDQVQVETMKLAQGTFGTAVFEQMSEVAAGFDEAAKSAQNYATALRDSTNAGAGFREGANYYVDSLGTLRQATSDLAQQGFQSLGDTITNLAINGTANFRVFAAGILRATAQMIIQQFVLKTIMQAIGFSGTSSANAMPAFDGNFYSSMSSSGHAFNPLGSGATGSFGLGSQFSVGSVFGGGRAAGGPVTGGTTYLVGERGPELFMPGRNGTIVPNGAMGGANVTVNVDASGNASVQGDQAQAKQLGVAVSAAVQAELVKQQRPGGLLSGTRR